MSRQYFINKKEAIFGPFPHLLAQTESIVTEINAKLEILDGLLVQQERNTGRYSLTEIRLFPLLRSLSIVKGISWPPRVNSWLREMAVRSRININDNIAI